MVKRAFTLIELLVV
ncbi:MAG: prepilin-type N-terminal cleavage/methylation domain-containing protein, partial [Chlorobia bacterium]|nr:prepilin-type N-terminal cleavage/methylation domain-containing protein [Fimbriimonadaceae bacterium]